MTQITISERGRIATLPEVEGHVGLKNVAHRRPGGPTYHSPLFQRWEEANKTRVPAEMAYVAPTSDLRLS